MTRTIFLLVIQLLCAANLFPGHAQAPANPAESDYDAIKRTALDYAEGWYEGNAERMERAVHPELAKRMVETNTSSGKSRLNQMGALTLVQNTRHGGGKNTPKDKQLKDVVILDVFENTASVRVNMSDWVDYLQMARFNGRWVIVNVLWEMKPVKTENSSGK